MLKVQRRLLKFLIILYFDTQHMYQHTFMTDFELRISSKEFY